MTIRPMEAHPAAFSCKREIAFGREITESELEQGMTKCLTVLTTGLRDLGCRLIGHIKGLLDCGNSGHLMFSITSFDDDVHFKGGIKGGIRKAVLTINIIVYGIETSKIEILFNEAIDPYI